MIKIINPLLNPTDLSADSALSYLNGCITNKYKAVINFSFQKYTSSQKRLQFTGHTITNINNLDNDSFIDTYNFLVGETIICPNSVHNNTTLTITGVTDRVITVSNSLTDETLEVGYLYVNKKITSLDFYYNLLANSDSISFLSKTDKQNFQKYTVSDIDATVSTPVLLNIGTKSFAWVTDVVTGIASTSSIAGAGMTGYTGITTAYTQSFTITHYFYEAPFFLKEYYNNFATDSPPLDFVNSQIISTPVNNGWQYICQINTKYATGVTYQDSAVSNRVNGDAAWFDQNNLRTKPDFVLDSIAYVNASTSLPMSVVDVGQDVNVTIKIKSPTAALNAGSTVMILNYFYCPLSDSTYQNTSTTLLQNFMFDKCVNSFGSGAVNGVNYGTNYQVLKTFVTNYVDPSNATITFTISYAAYLSTILKAKDASDRNYAISLCIESTND